MSEYIDRAEVLLLVDKGYLVSNRNYDKVRGHIENIPAADVVPVRNGHWIPHILGNANVPWGYDCSACGDWIVVGSDHIKKYKFCRNCGARMDGDT